MKTIAEVIASHAPEKHQPITGPFKCSCGWREAITLGHDMTGAWAEHVADAIAESRRLATPEQLDALPKNTLIESDEADLFEKQGNGTWWDVFAGGSVYLPSAVLSSAQLAGGVTVLRLGGDA